MSIAGRITGQGLDESMGRMLKTLVDSEIELKQELAKVRDRHQADNEIHHVLGLCRHWSLEHIRALRRHGETYGRDLPRDDDTPPLGALGEKLRQKSGEALKRSPLSGGLLLRDLRRCCLLAQQAALDCLIVRVGAHARRDLALMETVARCQDETERTIAVLKHHLKEESPHVLGVGARTTSTGSRP